MINFSLPTDYSDLGVVFLIGLVAGISTCGGLIASFVLAISAKNNANLNLSFYQKLFPHVIFNFGRVFFFTLFGVLAGWIGQYLMLNNFLIGSLVLFSSLYLLLLGVKMLKISKKIDRLDLSFKFLSNLIPQFDYFKQKGLTSSLGIFFLGGLTFFLPCGFTQAIQIFTLSLANPFYSGLTMFVFALGTTPGLLGIASATNLFNGDNQKILTKIIGIIVIYFSIINIINSFNLLGFNYFQQLDESQNFKISNGIQEINMIQTHKGYSPNLLVVKKNIPVKLTVSSKNNATCASYLVIEEYGVRRFLELGDNLIEFTPTKTGDIKFSCGMGMHPGIIRVIE